MPKTNKLLKTVLWSCLAAVSLFAGENPPPGNNPPAAEVTAATEILFQEPFTRPEALAGWGDREGFTVSDGGLKVELASGNADTSFFISKKLPAEKFAGRLCRFSAEISGSNIAPGKKKNHGAVVQFTKQCGQNRDWEGLLIPRGNFPARRFERVVWFPSDLTDLTLSIGFQGSFGGFQVRDLRVENLGVAVNITDAANHGFVDETAGDGKGGWSDQGPKQDARDMLRILWTHDFNGVPFNIAREKGILAMRHATRLPQAPHQAAIKVSPAVKARTLFVAHAVAWEPPATADQQVGVITLHDTAGKTQKIPVTYLKDVGNWYRQVARLDNAITILPATAADGNVIGMYASRYAVSPELGEIAGIDFTSHDNAIWMIGGATLAPGDIPLPKQEDFTITAGENWLPIPRNATNQIDDGCALDVSSLTPLVKVQDSGRVLVDPQGHFYLENMPGKTVRFLACAIHPSQEIGRQVPKDRLMDYARELRKNGYNMVRTHFLDQGLMRNAKADLDFDMELLDRFDYFVYCMKENGIYLNFDAMTSWLGYRPGDMQKNKDPRQSLKSRIYFEKPLRENWVQGVEKILCRENPYTKTRLIDDPVLAMVIGFNEQEFGFGRDIDENLVAPFWRDFLRRRYQTLDALKKEWGARAAAFQDFADIPCFSGPGSDVREDSRQFVYAVQTEFINWVQSELKRMGYKGPVANYNCGKSVLYNCIRRNAPLVAMNHYFAHPLGFISKNASLTQGSCLGNQATLLRNILGTRETDKPFVVTEHGHCFWNQYRYEQGFTVGAYGALQGFDALTCHAGPVGFQPINCGIMPFFLLSDPIIKAQEFLTYFMFVRGDVTPAAKRVRLRMRESDVLKKNGVTGGVPGEQTMLGLITGLSNDVALGDEEFPKIKENELAFKMGNATSVVVSNGFITSADNPAANAAEVVKQMKASGFLPPDNRSDGISVFESENRELYLDSQRNFMRVNTPRLQGVCAEAGTREKLPNLEISAMSQRGCLTLVSVDGLQPLSSAKRMVLVYATNALNSGQKFTNEKMTTLVSNGKLPHLLARGEFTVTVKNTNAGKLKLYPLELSGTRKPAVPAADITADGATFTVDTGKTGAAVFFEIVAEE